MNQVIVVSHYVAAEESERIRRFNQIVTSMVREALLAKPPLTQKQDRQQEKPKK